MNGAPLLDTKPEPARLASLDEMLARLARSPSEDSLVVSCYIKLGPRERSERLYVSELKSRIHELKPTIQTLTSSHEEREALMRDLARILEYCDQPSAPFGGGGLVFFASEQDGLFEVFALPHAHRFQLVFDRTPFVKPLIALGDEFGTMLAAVVDRARARMFEVTVFGGREVLDLTAWSMRGGRYHSDRQGAPGWGEHAYHNRIRTEKERHFPAVSKCLSELAKEKSIDGIALFGPGPTADAVVPFLRPDLSKRLLGTGRLNATTVTPATVHKATMTLAVSASASRAAETVSDFREAIGREMAVNGLRETLRALFQGQVRTLIVDEAATASGFRCRDSGHLVLKADECESQGAAEPAPYLIDDILEEALRQDLPITFIENESVPEIESIAGILRFR